MIWCKVRYVPEADIAMELKCLLGRRNPLSLHPSFLIEVKKPH
jgi:hypothetical protein